MVEYVGEVINTVEANRRLSEAIATITALASTARHTDLLPGTYLLQFTSGLVIDAQHVGNLARFVNHSCEPNSVVKACNVGGTLRLGQYYFLIHAKRNHKIAALKCLSVVSHCHL